MTKHGFEPFTFLFYFFERIILRLKSAQLDKWYIFYIFPLYLAVQGHFCVLFNIVGEKMPKMPKHGSKNFTFLFYFFF